MTIDTPCNSYIHPIRGLIETTTQYKDNRNIEYSTYNVTACTHSLQTSNIFLSPTYKNLYKDKLKIHLCSNNKKLNEIQKPNITLSPTNINLIKIVLTKK